MAAKLKPGVPPPAHSALSAHQKFLGAVTQVPIAGLTAKDISDQGLVPLNPSDPKSDLVKVTPSGPETHDRTDAQNSAPVVAPTSVPIAPATASAVKNGWTGSLIAPDARVHQATALAIDHVGNADAHAAATNPNHPEYRANFTNTVLNDPRLGSRSIGSANAAPGAPVGSASTFQNSGIPASIQAAVNNFSANSNANPMSQFLSQIFGGGAPASAAVTPVAATPSAAQDAYYNSQTALNNQRFATQAAPAQIQSNINSNLSANPATYGVMSLNPAMPGSYNPSANNALVDLYGNLNTAKQAASGWTSPTY